MADYYQVKNQNIFNPPANTSLGNATNQFDDVFIQNDLVLGNTTVTGATIVTPKVSTITYPGDDTAADTAGGQTITLTGSGFLTGASVLINGSAVGVVSVVSTTTITFTSPANATGSYVLYVINTDGGTAIAIPGIQYSGTPNWTTAAGSLGSVYETASFNQSVTATGDAPITYSVASGSIPPGATFNSNGTITGTSQVLSSSTTYTFTVKATDAELQDTNRTFSLTINPDVVTWSSPANGTTYTSNVDSAISNITLSATSAVGSGITYTANALPTGLSLTGANISGTPTVVANSSSLLTATANTTSESSNVTINWVINVANDTYFEYNTLLIPGASTTFVDDASTNNFAVTINGDTKPNNFNPYTPGYYSNQFTAQGQYLTFGTSSTLALGAGSFTVELWLNLNAYNASTSTLIDWRTAGNAGLNAPSFSIGANGILDVYLNISSGIAVSASSAIPLNTWTHIACVRNGTALTLYFNGVSVGTGTSAVNCSIETFRVNDTQGSYYTNCSISNLRIVKGTAVYTSAFTPSTTPLTAITNTVLLTCQSNRFIDNSSNNFTVTVGGSPTINSFDPFTPNNSYSTYGSGYFDGTGDYLSVATNSAFNVSTNNITAEAWVYLTAFNTAGNPFISTIWSLDSSGSNNTFAYIYNTGAIAVGINGINEIASSVGVIKTGAWYHTAVVRNGSTTTIYVNGVSVATNTTSVWANTGSRPFLVGSTSQSANYYLTGYISDIRFVNGTAVYTTAFTPPTTPLTAISGTSLLTLQNNQSVNNNVFLDNSTSNFLVTRNGNATQGTFSPYGGNWSNYFDGTGDYLSIPSTTALQFGTGNFTVESWVYLTATPSAQYAQIIGRTEYGSNADWMLQITNALKLTFYLGSTASFIVTSTASISLNTWTHVAVSRSSNSFKLFINGVVDGTATNSGSAEATGTGVYTIGADQAGDEVLLTGYLSNLRVVKGTAVYTSSFTPSTTPLTPITNTSLLTCADNRLVDDSINNLAITRNGDVSVQRFSPFNPSSLTPTSYSGYFDGTGDYLTLASNSAFQITGDFTIEAWVYATSITAWHNIMSQYQNSTNDFACGYNVTQGWYFNYANNAAEVANYRAGTSPLNTWTHVAFVKSSTTMTIYVNGTALASTITVPNLPLFSSTLNIGIWAGSMDSLWNGYISNLRMVKGVAVYTGAFTVPTSPLTATQSSGTNIAAITGTSTSLLTCQSPTFIDSSTNNFTISAFGNSQPTQQNPFGYTSATTEGYTVSTIGGSGYFDGTGDYLTVPRSTLCIPGASQNFTIEAWVYSERAAGVTPQQIMGFHRNGVSADWVFSITSSNYPEFYVDGLGTLITSSIIVNPYIWNHIAVVRKNTNTITLYVNGVSGGTATSASALTGNGANPLSIGSDYNGASFLTKGYITDARIVNGTALYTSNFVPPLQPLTAVQNTVLLNNMTGAGIYDAAMMNNMETVGDAKLSTAVSKFGGSSMSFDGSGDLLKGVLTPNAGFGTGDFTVECWLYVSAFSNATGYMGIYSNRTVNGSLSTAFDFGIQNSTSKLYFYNANTDGTTFSTGTLSATTWIHVALVRSGSTITFYINGTASGSLSSSSNLGTSNAPYVGGNANSSPDYYNGYIDDLRITKGYARYTSNFTPPTSAFPIY